MRSRSACRARFAPRGRLAGHRAAAQRLAGRRAAARRLAARRAAARRLAAHLVLRRPGNGRAEPRVVPERQRSAARDPAPQPPAGVGGRRRVQPRARRRASQQPRPRPPHGRRVARIRRRSCARSGRVPRQLQRSRRKPGSVPVPSGARSARWRFRAKSGRPSAATVSLAEAFPDLLARTDGRSARY